MEITQLQKLTHELRNPLHALMVTTEVLRSQLRKLSPEIANHLNHYLDSIISEIKRLEQTLTLPNSQPEITATEKLPAKISKQPKSGKHTVLIVDDEKVIRESMMELLSSWGYEVITAADGAEALYKINKQAVDIIICDLIMPKISGLELLKKIKQKLDVPIILLTAQGSIDSAVAAMKQGASDYLTKPIDPVRLQKLLAQLSEMSEYMHEIRTLRLQLRELGRFGPMVGKSELMRRLYQDMELAAPSQASVIIEGASGTGKELVAREIHALSPRHDKAFIAINCSAIPATLLESEIFGYERGAFTGANKTKEGCFELAHEGTLFLDEIVEMHPDLQIKLLRVLESGNFRRIGGKVELKASVRLIAASNMDFRQAIAKGKLRQDLYYRLNVFNFKIPPLSERIEDIPLLTQHFIQEFNQQNNKQLQGATHEVLTCLQNYNWPGNVRELRNVIERAVIVSKKIMLGLNDIVEHVRDARSSVEKLRNAKNNYPKMLIALGMPLEKITYQVITKTLELTHGNKTAAAKKLGITPKTLHNKIRNLQ